MICLKLLTYSEFKNYFFKFLFFFIFIYDIKVPMFNDMTYCVMIV